MGININCIHCSKTSCNLKSHNWFFGMIRSFCIELNHIDCQDRQEYTKPLKNVPGQKPQRPPPQIFEEGDDTLTNKYNSNFPPLKIEIPMPSVKPPKVGSPYPPFPGTQWKHKKTGGIYTIISIAIHSETKENLIVYSDETGTWARPLNMFFDGRFELIVKE